MKKQDELIEAVIKLKKIANEQGIIINEISLESFWFTNPIEMAPVKLMGIPIK